MDIYFNYPQGDSSIYELEPDSTVRDLYDHASAKQDCGPASFVVIYNDEHLLDMDVSIESILDMDNQMKVEALCDDPDCAMSIRYPHQR